MSAEQQLSLVKVPPNKKQLSILNCERATVGRAVFSLPSEPSPPCQAVPGPVYLLELHVLDGSINCCRQWLRLSHKKRAGDFYD